MIALWCAAGALLFSSCDSGSGDQTTDTTTETATTAATDTSITEDNKELMKFAARNNLLQIELGKMAAAQGTSDSLKAYGQDLVDWYTTKQEELQKLAQDYSVTLPQQLEEEENEHLNKLREAKAEGFDGEYWDRLTEAQNDAIEEFEDGLKDVDEAAATPFSFWARNTLKELRAQYEQAKGREVELKRRDTGLNLENDN